MPTGAECPQGPMKIGLSDQNLDFGVSGLANGSQMALHNAQHTIAVDFHGGYGFAQVFAPHDAPLVSLEPMTAPIDALRRGENLPVAGPERAYTASFALSVRPTRAFGP
jgi:aldose 1-epimerase